MAKNSISDYDTTSGNNTDVQSVDISEGCAASGINNAIREVMTDMADAFTQGTPIKLDQTNNRVMINTTTEGFADYADTLTVADTDHAGITIRSGTSSSGSLYFSDATSGSGEYDGYLNYNQSTQKLTVGTAAATRMTIDSSGDVAIGQDTTRGKLTVKTANATASDADFDVIGLASEISLAESNKTATLLAAYDTATYGAAIGYSYVSPGYNLIFGTNDDTSGNPIERMRLTSGGELLVGASSFSNSSNVKRISAGTIDCARNSTSALTQVTFQNPNGQVGQIFTSGTSTSYATSSDHRLKENVADMTGAINRVKQLAPKRFNFIADADTTVDGFLAHEAQAVVPEAVSGTHNAVDDDGNAVMQGIDQSKLVPLLTGALKEAIAKIETLETKVAALENA